MPEIIKNMPTRKRELSALIIKDWTEIYGKISSLTSSEDDWTSIRDSIIELASHYNDLRALE